MDLSKNTYDILGDNALTEQLIEGTIKEFASTHITQLKAYAFDGCTYLSRVYLPNLSTLPAGCFFNSGLREVIMQRDLPKITSLQSSRYAFAWCSALELFDCGNIKNMDSFWQCFNYSGYEFIFRGEECTTSSSSYGFTATTMRILRLPNAKSFSNLYGLRENYWLQKIIIGEEDGDEVASLSNSLLEIIQNSQLALSINDYPRIPDFIKRNCGIYVPDALLDDYKSATNWVLCSEYIKPLSDLDEDGEDINNEDIIRDSWETIGQKIESGDYVNDYRVGQKKKLYLPYLGCEYAKLIKIKINDSDETETITETNGEQTKTVWVFENQLRQSTHYCMCQEYIYDDDNITYTPRLQNDMIEANIDSITNIGGYRYSYPKYILDKSFLDLDNNIKGFIKPVDKMSIAAFATEKIQYSSEYLWLFSNEEIQGASDAIYHYLNDENLNNILRQQSHYYNILNDHLCLRSMVSAYEATPSQASMTRDALTRITYVSVISPAWNSSDSKYHLTIYNSSYRNRQIGLSNGRTSFEYPSGMCHGLLIGFCI